MTDAERAVDELQLRLRRHPPDRYPVQHATDRFHLACALLDAGRADEAVDAAAVAVELFGPMPAERAKAHNVLGIALRMAGRGAEAGDAFRSAESGFAAAGLELEEAAAAYNLGLVAAETGDPDAAVDAFGRARARFGAQRARPQEAASARELGQALLVAGRTEEAAEILAGAVALAERVGDRAGYGAASNALGLTLLASGDPAAAVDAFLAAGSVHPRSVRPDAYAMAKANLALALERSGDPPRARLAASQARDVPAAAPVVRAQAEGVLRRLGAASGRDLVTVLDGEPPEHRPAVVREEVLRWLDVGGHDPDSWLEAILERSGREADLLEAWLDVALELAPPAMRKLLDGMAAAAARAAAGEQDRVRVAMSSAALRFAGPQWDRLRAELATAVAANGLDPAAWR